MTLHMVSIRGVGDEAFITLITLVEGVQVVRRQLPLLNLQQLLGFARVNNLHVFKLVRDWLLLSVDVTIVCCVYWLLFSDDVTVICDA